MEFFPDRYHSWWPIAVKQESTPGDDLVESTILSVCLDPQCGVYGTRRLSGHCDLTQIQELTLRLDAHARRVFLVAQ
jgi:hypothetical protein